MRFTAKRLLAAGAIGISAIVTPLSLTAALSGVAGAPSSVAGAAAFDQITYNQFASGSPLDTDQYLPAAGGGPAPQALNVSGNCATPTATPPPSAALSICGQLWSLGFTGTPKLANLGTNPMQGPATGVGAITPAWTIDTKSNKGAEAIDFSPGDPSIIGPNRVFTDAQIPVARKDTGNSGIGSVTVELAEFSSTQTTQPPTQPSAATLLGLQDCTLTGNTGAQLTFDPTLCPVTYSKAGDGKVPSIFQTIEVRDTTPSTAIAVVGPTATFELATQVCGGQSIQAIDTGGVQASLSLPPGAGCKTYSSFISGTDPNTGQANLSFNGYSSSPVQFTVQITWPYQKQCQPYDDPQMPAPGNVAGIPPDLRAPGGVCAPHQVSFDGTTYYDQTYCGMAVKNAQLPEPQAGLCTADKQYNDVQIDYGANDASCPPPQQPPPNQPACIPVTSELMLHDGVTPATQIVETWIGYIDWYAR
jgi:hypothetical protein